MACCDGLSSAWGGANDGERRTMEPRKLFTDERGVSPVVGVALLIAIAVILAAVIGAVVLGLGTGGADTPQAQLQGDYNTTGNTLEVTHRGGQPILADNVVVVENGDESALTAETDDLSSGDELSTGQTIALNGTGNANHNYNGSTVTLIWEDPNSDSENILEEFDP
jgi:flagellin-like protein